MKKKRFRLAGRLVVFESNSLSLLAKAMLICCVFCIPLTVGAADQKKMSNKFGFLGGEMSKKTAKMMNYSGAGWMRPHLGPAVWQLIQDNKSAEYDWDYMDETVKWHQDRGINLLITIWPFATWDQKNRNNANECKVAADDQFLRDAYEDDKQQPYLPRYRCNPNNWKKYRAWVKAMVERYDGDGVDDYEKLQWGIKHWEVMNEPDLAPGTEDPDDAEVLGDDKDKDHEDEGEESLDFYQQNYKAYYKLLKKTHAAIKYSDPKAKVLIAGAAGGGTEPLSFYDNLFNKYPKAKKYFDLGNVHCISNDYYNNFNVKAYDRLLRKHGINKNIWVTEAEAFLPEDDTQKEKYQQTRKSTKKALAAGAKKIFFTRITFSEDGYGADSAAWKYARKKYKIIFDKFR